MLKREQYTAILRSGEVSITFKKKNGELRVLRCSLNEDLLPPKPPVEFTVEKPDRTVHLDQIRVFDLDSMSWRSFMINSVTVVETADHIYVINQEE